MPRAPRQSFPRTRLPTSRRNVLKVNEFPAGTDALSADSPKAEGAIARSFCTASPETQCRGDVRMSAHDTASSRSPSSRLDSIGRRERLPTHCDRSGCVSAPWMGFWSPRLGHRSRFVEFDTSLEFDAVAFKSPKP